MTKPVVVKKVNKRVLFDHLLKADMIAVMISISKNAVYRVLTEKLKVRMF